jgi:hypothetical protein
MIWQTIIIIALAYIAGGVLFFRTAIKQGTLPPQYHGGYGRLALCIVLWLPSLLIAL